jgi:hypothetical protein
LRRKGWAIVANLFIDESTHARTKKQISRRGAPKFIPVCCWKRLARRRDLFSAHLYCNKFYPGAGLRDVAVLSPELHLQTPTAGDVFETLLVLLARHDSCELGNVRLELITESKSNF